jgi:polyhydroxybutyrate depolymerase
MITRALTGLVGLALLVLPAFAQPARERSPASMAHSISVEGRERSYRLHVPRGGGTSRPLLIVLHGTFGTGQKMERGLGFDPQADRHGFVVAYPDAFTPSGAGQSLRWNDGRGTLPSSKQGIDDVRFLAALIDDVARRTGIDRTAVFLTGASNGGIMAYRAACEAPELFAGVAPVIGNIAAPMLPACRPTRPVSLLAINGVADRFVPYAGGTVCAGVPKRLCEGGQVASAAQSVAMFARAAGCAATPTRTRRPVTVQDGTDVEDVRHSNCATGTEVSLIAIHGGGHSWPPRPSQMGARRAGASSANLNATDEVVAFMARVRPQAR